MPRAPDLATIPADAQLAKEETKTCRDSAKKALAEFEGFMRSLSSPNLYDGEGE